MGLAARSWPEAARREAGRRPAARLAAPPAGSGPAAAGRRALLAGSVLGSESPEGFR